MWGVGPKGSADWIPSPFASVEHLLAQGVDGRVEDRMPRVHRSLPESAANACFKQFRGTGGAKHARRRRAAHGTARSLPSLPHGGLERSSSPQPRAGSLQSAAFSLPSHHMLHSVKAPALASSHAPWLRSARHASWPAPQRVQSAPARLVRDKAIQKQICSVTRKTIWTCKTMCALRAPELLRMQPK
jgi:hypothetical protein